MKNVNILGRIYMKMEKRIIEIRFKKQLDSGESRSFFGFFLDKVLILILFLTLSIRNHIKLKVAFLKKRKKEKAKC